MTILDDITSRLRDRESEMAGTLSPERARFLYEEGLQLQKHLQICRARLRQQYLASAGEQNWVETARGGVMEPSGPQWRGWG
jgi:hypothetical protein